MNDTVDFGWYYISENDRAPAWSSVEYFYDFFTGAPAFAAQNGGVGPYATVVPSRQAEIGDAVQLADGEGDWYHTLIISKIEGNEIFVCAHSDDALDRPLSTYRQAAAVRFLHIEGVRFEVADDVCFEALINGGEEIPLAEDSESPAQELPIALPENDRPDVIEGS